MDKVMLAGAMPQCVYPNRMQAGAHDAIL